MPTLRVQHHAGDVEYRMTFSTVTFSGIAPHELEPFYVRVERDWGVSGHPNDTAFPPGEGPPIDVPELPVKH